MSFQPIKNFEQSEAEKKNQRSREISFLSVNYNAGGYLGGRLEFLLNSPRWLLIEYDTVTNSLRFKPTHDPAATRVKKRMFPLPEPIRHAMGKKPKAGKATIRYNVKQANDGWWYTTPYEETV